MKIHFVLMASVLALLFGGCANDSMMTDEEYDSARSGPAPRSPDPMSHVNENDTSGNFGTGAPRY